MQKVMLMMDRRFLAQTLMKSLKSDERFSFFAEYDYQNAALVASAVQPDIAVVEVPESKAWRAMDYLTVCGGIRSASPHCRVLFFCPENSQDSRSVAIEAKRSGAIDDFIFFDTSWNYLVSKLEALS